MARWFLIGACCAVWSDAACRSASAAESAPEVTRVASPDGRISVRFVLAKGQPFYELDYDQSPLVKRSPLGLGSQLQADYSKLAEHRKSIDQLWQFEFGERRDIPDRYNELTIELARESGAKINLIMRAYNEGFALRYHYPEAADQSEDLVFEGESTHFSFPAGFQGYEAHGTEGGYGLVPINEITRFCERPLTLVGPTGTYVAIGEAGNLDYARMLLSRHPENSDTLVSDLGGKTSNTKSESQPYDANVRLKPGQSTPWRVVMVGDSPGQLLENNYLFLNLNPPCALKDTSWIKPGKVMRDGRLTTKNAKEIIDFAETAGLSYVHLDTNWYGGERDRSADATTLNPERIDTLDLKEIVRYGDENNVGVIVYVNQIHLLKHEGDLFPLYHDWGLRGIKYGFVKVGPQSETKWITDSLERAAENRLMINIHDGFRANGLNRTYPNLMTVEGIRGNEHMPTAKHNCTLPFTRYLCGIGDYTVCYYNKRIQTTHAHQLAMSVISYSPLQWILWYDSPSHYHGEPEIEFFREVPTVWDETRVLHGDIGKYAVIARRKNDSWFIGAINAESARSLDLSLDFLDKDREYIAKIYSDDESVQSRTEVRVEERTVNQESALSAAMLENGGQAMWIRPK